MSWTSCSEVGCSSSGDPMWQSSCSSEQLWGNSFLRNYLWDMTSHEEALNNFCLKQQTIEDKQKQQTERKRPSVPLSFVKIHLWRLSRGCRSTMLSINWSCKVQSRRSCCISEHPSAALSHVWIILISDNNQSTFDYFLADTLCSLD